MKLPLLSALFGQKHQPHAIADVYLGLRQQVLELPRRGLDLGPSDRCAILMETGMDDACCTLVAVADGGASLYFSNGGGIIGAGEHPDCAAAAKAFLETSRKFDHLLKPAAEQPLPSPGMVRFTIVRQSDILTGEFKEDDLGHGRLPLSPLFHFGHNLIAMMRQLQEQRRRG